MKNRRTLLAFGVVALASLMALPMVMDSTDAAPVKPPLFPPISSCGTIEDIEYEDLDGNIVVCKVWKADKGGKYRFDGIDDYNDGDRVHVKGLICTICTTFCGGGVPIMNSIDGPCQ